ncbi:hypothetical protein, conserved in T. vivax [Trypanosoma vivax Y486]|uniref:Uncharacterized protein n=1 Tax=Trypanosoma vivax (strain Y486) TaxID=1055687 RepID=F9WRB8_TRYVY|nr:hypothetical protein, conserved in T. vivax [Trypanosoma vivax Y486]|eukprot:CCD20102.1 hypothetical protein, conserved in T. vivax [Trypanosoma vivax Y486]
MPLILHIPHHNQCVICLLVKHNSSSHGTGLVEDVRRTIHKIRHNWDLRRVVVQKLVQQVRPAAKRLADAGRPNQHVRTRIKFSVVIGPPSQLTSHNVPHTHHLATYKNITFFFGLKLSKRPTLFRRQNERLETTTLLLIDIFYLPWIRCSVHLSVRPNALRTAINYTHAKRHACIARLHVAPPRIHHGLEGARNNSSRRFPGLIGSLRRPTAHRSIKRGVQKATDRVPQPFIRQRISHRALGVRIFVRTAPPKDTCYSMSSEQWNSPVNKRVRLTLRKAQDASACVFVRNVKFWFLDHHVHPHVTVNICSTMANTLKTLAQQHNVVRWWSTIQQHICHTAVQRPRRGAARSTTQKRKRSMVEA